jgi:primosomal protein N' (replication factor Y)
MCHYCGFSMNFTDTCPTCNNKTIKYAGFGTQRFEDDIENIFPNAKVLRMDADTTLAKYSYEDKLKAFANGEYDILLGTQMVAKGLNFPRVTLVGVALADTSLYVSDFRAAERTFALLTQVIGRAGRAKEGGIAVIQTFSPTNETIRLACRQDYESFYDGEIAIRRELSYPPFCDMVQLTLTGEDEVELLKEVRALSESLIKRLEGEYGKQPFIVFGPFEAQVYKLNDKYRMRMIVKCRLNAFSRALFRELLCEFSVKRGVTLAIDLNPLTV